MRKSFIMLCLLSLGALCSHAQDAWETTYKQIEARIVAPTFRDKCYKASVKQANSARKNQKAINSAIARCSKAGGGKVVIPKGKYMTGAITLLSGVNLVIDEGAELVFAFDRDLYPNVVTRWEGLDIINYQPCIYAYGQKNIGLTGKGIINGNGSNERWWYMKGNKHHGYHEGVDEWQGTDKIGTRAQLLKMADNAVPVEKRVFGKGKGLRPQLVNFVKCENAIIEGVELRDSPFWVIHPLFVKNLIVRDVKIYNEGPNGDGCDPESCEDVLIEGCTFHTGDDCIALKSGRNADGLRAATPSQNIIIRRCKMADGHGGVVIGSEISGGVRNVFAEDCDMDSPNLDRVIRIKTNTCRGGVNENIYVRNIRVGEEIAERGHIPTVRNVYVDNVVCKKSKYGILLNGLTEKDSKTPQIYNINVTNCNFGGLSAEPLYKTGLVKDIKLENVTVSGSL